MKCGFLSGTYVSANVDTDQYNNGLFKMATLTPHFGNTAKALNNELLPLMPLRMLVPHTMRYSVKLML